MVTNEMLSRAALDALGHQTRRDILALLRAAPLPVGDIASRLPISRPAVSKHLRILERAGLVQHTAHGTQIQCHVCGRWFGQLHIHTTRMHGLNAADYKECYGLARSASLLSPQTAELQRQAAIARGQGHKGIPFGPDNPPVPRTGIANRLSSKIRSCQAHKDVEREDREQERAEL
jgi:hypothetical protein